MIMWTLYKMRRQRPPSSLLPEGLSLRTIRSPFHVVLDSKTNNMRVSSAAFEPTDDGAVSIELGQLLETDTLSLTALYPSLTQSVALVAHKVGTLRGKSLTVHHEPMVENWYHGGIRGDFKQAVKRHLAKNCIFVVGLDAPQAKKFWEQSNGRVWA